MVIQQVLNTIRFARCRDVGPQRFEYLDRCVEDRLRVNLGGLRRRSRDSLDISLDEYALLPDAVDGGRKVERYQRQDE